MIYLSYRFKQLFRVEIYRKNWRLIIGRDAWNSEAGITFQHGEIEPFGEWRRWKTNFRLNLRWPISMRFK